MVLNWQCPFCGRQAALTEASYCVREDYFSTEDDGKDGSLKSETRYIVCPNPDCKEYTIETTFFAASKIPLPGFVKGVNKGEELLRCFLRPKGSAKPQPDYIPASLREDYKEACLILEDSPKASATLSRRCLQWLIRDYYKISKDRLYDEIKALEKILPNDLWKAVDGIREVGNVGAHSEKDVTKMVDVKPEAAHALIELVELLFEETYVKDHERQKRIKRATAAASDVKTQKES